ncbi:MAG: hypothetical protein ACQESP_08660 [Candidatus Muiribacteriota bacterium]
MEDLLLIAVVFSLLINIMLVFAYMRLKKAIMAMELKKYKNCIIAMLEAKEQFEKITELRLSQIKARIRELEDVTEDVDDKILYYESLKENDQQY